MAAKSIEIITGRYGLGTEEQNSAVDSILGGSSAKENFELYFHWYNLIHELGHGIMCFNGAIRPHPVEEERLVNDFAVAFWLYYGEERKVEALKGIVSHALAHVTRPIASGISHIDYAATNWGKREFWSFNNYGWFQFSCVADSLASAKSLSPVLELMGVLDARVQPRQTFAYSLDDDNAPRDIVMNAAAVLRRWGAVIPAVRLTFINDPNRHMCNIASAES